MRACSRSIAWSKFHLNITGFDKSECSMVVYLDFHNVWQVLVGKILHWVHSSIYRLQLWLEL